jgi:DNA-binding MarR family transcriptional regulator
MSEPYSSSDFTKVVPEPLIGALLRMPLEVVHRRMLDRLHEHGFDDLDMPHLKVCQYPGPHGLRPSELAARLGISKQALNYLLRELERLGYLRREPDGDDLRSRRIMLTERGTALIPVIRGAVAEVEAEWAAELGSERFAALRGLLVDLNHRL